MTADRNQHRDSILALLEERPYKSREFAEILGVKYSELIELLHRMRRAGEVVMTGRSRATAWRLSSGFTHSNERTKPEPGAVSASPVKLSSASRQTARQALAGQAVRSGPPSAAKQWSTNAILSRPSTTSPRRGRPRGGRIRLTGAGAAIDRLLEIDEPLSGEAVCPRCGTRFHGYRAVALAFCSTRCAEAPPLDDQRTVIVNGIEYEATSVGSRAVTRAYAGGSSCTNQTPPLDFRRR